MNKINTQDLIVTDLSIPSIPFYNNWVGGIDGMPQTHVGTDEQQRPIDATIQIMSHDYLDYNLLRDYLYQIFRFNKTLYIVDNRQPYKRYRVVLQSNFSPVRNASNNGTATIRFVTEKTPYAESIETTLEGAIPNFRGIPPFDLSNLEYTHTTNEFEIYNHHVPIHPFKQDLIITISDVEGGSFGLKNLTNGTEFQINDEVSNSQMIKLDGPNVTSNGLQFLRSTNKKFIELSPGWNQFEVTGATSAKVEFDFRFYYD